MPTAVHTAELVSVGIDAVTVTPAVKPASVGVLAEAEVSAALVLTGRTRLLSPVSVSVAVSLLVMGVNEEAL